jgi:transposase-like protein
MRVQARQMSMASPYAEVFTIVQLIHPVLRQVAEEWKMPPKEWAEAKTQFAIMRDERFVIA